SVDLVKSKIDLVQLVGSYVPGLKKSGRNWWACCPFHTEKTASFCIWPDDDRWKCFGCGAGGDAFAFVMRHDNLDFPGALKVLAEKAGVTLDERPRRPEDSARKQRLLELNAAASLWFHSMLLEDARGAAARQFVERRHLNHQIVLDFQLGYTPESWDSLRNHLTERGYSVDEQLAAGVLHESDRGQPYDRFRNRFIFPIRDAGGHIVAFGGRDLGDDKRSAKFINSPQTDLFDKSATLYALDRAKNAIRSRDRVIVVEGYMDAIMAHQHGETNVVCSMGTSLTERQLEQIKRLTTNLVLALDPDTAGDIAAGRGVEIGQQVFDRELVPVLSVRGLVRLESRLKADIRVMSLPRGKDPDEVIAEDLELWQRLVQEALPLMEYKFQQIVAKHDLSNARGKTELVDELGAELALIPDRLQQHHYIGRLAQLMAGVAGAFQLREADLHEAVTRARARRQAALRTAARPKAHEPDGAPDEEPSSSAPAPALKASTVPLGLDTEDFLVMRALRYLDDAPLWRENLRTDEVVKSETREVLQFLLTYLDRGSTTVDLPATAARDLPEAVASHVFYLKELAAQEPEIPEPSRRAEFDRLVLKIREQAAARKQAERATLLAQSPEARAREVESGALDDLAALHLSKSELTQRTLLAHS
ncbi:MAG TPA: DNA primase, partial [Chloroflexota bacterium]|nr:DNA primase [Chloroflexota bacterium]